MKLGLTYHAAQEQMFFGPSVDRWNIHPKGRRFGATQGAAHACLEWLLEGKQILWGDTINSNIDRYVDRYFAPPLRRSGVKLSDVWRPREKQMKLGRGIIDFRSADNPERWEGFGYHRLILNEAGIILGNPYLYRNAVLPMMIDFDESMLWAIGTPKGATGVFYDLWQSFVRGEPGFHGKRYTTYDNPFLSRDSIDLLRQEIGPDMAPQEIEGRFISISAAALFTAEDLLDAQARTPEPVEPGTRPQYGLDVAWTGQDSSTLYRRHGRNLERVWKLDKASPTEVAARALQAARAGPDFDTRPIVNVDVIGIGAGVYDLLSQTDEVEAVPVNAAERPYDDEKYANVRAEAMFALRDFVRDDDGVLPDVPELRRDLAAAEFAFDGRGRFKLPTKDKLKAKTGRSPDDGDAAALAVWRAPTAEVWLL